MEEGKGAEVPTSRTIAAGPPLDPRVARSRAAVLEAATRLLVGGGPGALTIEGLVSASGVAKTTIYRHWASRNEVLWSTLDLLIPPPAEVEVDGPMAANLVAFLEAGAHEVFDAPWAALIPGMLDAAERDPELREFRTRIAERQLRPLRAILARGVEKGDLAVGLDAEEAASYLTGPLLYRRFVSREPIDRAYCQRLVDRFIRANSR